MEKLTSTQRVSYWSRMRRAGYSIWTGYSFKAPLLASAVACLLGNLAYSLSYDARALWLLVLARLVTGLGARTACMQDKS